MNLLEKFARINCFVFDVDGVLTNGNLLILEDGQMARKMNIKDGYALQLALKKGYSVLIISGGSSEPVRERLNRLGVKDVHLKVQDKLAVLTRFQHEKELNIEEMLYMGDDIPDYEVMLSGVLPCAPADAAHEILGISEYISPQRGGSGCARDVIEKVLRLRGDWPVDVSIRSK